MKKTTSKTKINVVWENLFDSSHGSLFTALDLMDTDTYNLFTQYERGYGQKPEIIAILKSKGHISVDGKVDFMEYIKNNTIVFSRTLTTTFSLNTNIYENDITMKYFGIFMLLLNLNQPKLKLNFVERVKI